MKKIIVPLSIALMFVVAPLAAAADLQSDLMANEKTMWTLWAKKDADSYKKLLTEDAVGITGGGAPVVGREANAKAVKNHSCELRNVSFKDVSMRRIGKDAALLTYTATQDLVCGGKQMPPKVVSTSLWQLQDGKWLGSYYHESPLVE